MQTNKSNEDSIKLGDSSRFIQILNKKFLHQNKGCPKSRNAGMPECRNAGMPEIKTRKS